MVAQTDFKSPRPPLDLSPEIPVTASLVEKNLSRILATSLEKRNILSACVTSAIVANGGFLLDDELSEVILKQYLVSIKLEATFMRKKNISTARLPMQYRRYSSAVLDKRIAGISVVLNWLTTDLDGAEQPASQKTHETLEDLTVNLVDSLFLSRLALAELVSSDSLAFNAIMPIVAKVHTAKAASVPANSIAYDTLEGLVRCEMLSYMKLRNDLLAGIQEICQDTTITLATLYSAIIDLPPKTIIVPPPEKKPAPQYKPLTTALGGMPSQIK